MVGQQPGVDLDGPDLTALVAQSIVQQVDQYAAQVVGVKVHPQTQRAQEHLYVAPGRVLLQPVAADTVYCLVQFDLHRRRMRPGQLGDSGNLQHLVDDFSQAQGVVPHHGGQPLLGRVRQVFFQQGVGLGDGRQRVADFVGYGSRHAAHGSHFFGAQPGFHFPQIVQKHHAQAVNLPFHGRSHAGAHPHPARAATGVLEVDVGLLRRFFSKSFLCQREQRMPARLAAQLQRCVAAPAAGTQQQAGGRVCRVGVAAGVHHQHAIGEGFNYQFVDPGLQLRGHLAAQRQMLFALQPGRQLVD